MSGGPPAKVASALRTIGLVPNEPEGVLDAQLTDRAIAPSGATRLTRPVHRRLPTWHRLVLFAGVFAVLCAHVMSLGYMKFANPDEAYAMGIAQRLLEGHRLYAGAVSQRGPLMYYVFEVLAKLTGWDNVLAIRLWALVFAFAHLALAYFTARILLSRRAALITGAIVSYALAFGLVPYEGIALHGETILVPALVAGALFGGLAVRAPAGSRARLIHLCASGLALGFAASVKQSVLLHPLPVLAWLAIDARQSRRWLRAFAVDASIFVAAFIAIPATLLLQAWANGTLKQLVYYCYTYNVTIHTKQSNISWLAALPADAVEAHPAFLITVAAVLAFTIHRWWSRLYAALRNGWRGDLVRGFDVVDYLALHFAVALLVAASITQFFEHYYIVVIPFLALALAGYVTPSTRTPYARKLLETALVGVAAFYMIAGVRMAAMRESADGRVAHGIALEKAAAYIAKKTSPQDKIFVWGFSPWLYGYSHRRPASRFMFVTYPTGFIPWFWQSLPYERDRVVPETMSQLLSDLDREKPKLVVDAGSSFIARSMRAYTRSSEWLHEHYCFDARVGPFDVYLLKPDNGECRTTYFPHPAPPVNHFDMPIPALAPMVVDYETSRWLPPGNYDEPIRFDLTNEVCLDRCKPPAPAEGRDEMCSLIPRNLDLDVPPPPQPVVCQGPAN